jgi:hypothetical protein
MEFLLYLLTFFLLVIAILLGIAVAKKENGHSTTSAKKWILPALPIVGIAFVWWLYWFMTAVAPEPVLALEAQPVPEGRETVTALEDWEWKPYFTVNWWAPTIYAVPMLFLFIAAVLFILARNSGALRRGAWWFATIAAVLFIIAAYQERRQCNRLNAILSREIGNRAHSVPSGCPSVRVEREDSFSVLTHYPSTVITLSNTPPLILRNFGYGHREQAAR